MDVNAGGNKNALNREIGMDGMREWSHGLLDFSNECRLCTWGQTGTTKTHRITDCCLRPQAAGPRGALVSFIARTSNVLNICETKALLCQVVVKDSLTTPTFTAS